MTNRSTRHRTFPAIGALVALCATTSEAASTARQAAGPPPAQAVYRCGNTYSAQRCGDAAALAVDDPRTAADRAQGADVTARQKRLASTLEAQRRARDAPPALPAAARARAGAPCVAASAASRTWSAAATPHASCTAPAKGRKRARKAPASDSAASGLRVVTLPAARGKP